MRKLVVLMLVLGLASLANATLVINVGGVAVPSITIAPLQTVSISITTDASIASAGGLEGYALLVGPAAGLAIKADAATTITSDVFAMNVSDAGATVPAGTDGVYMGIFNFGAAYAAGSTIVGGLTLQGLTAGQYVATLYNVDAQDGSTITGTAGTLGVTVTPEPATLAILGLADFF